MSTGKIIKTEFFVYLNKELYRIVHSGKSLKLQKKRYLLNIQVIIYFMEVQKIFLYTLIRKLRMF